MAEIIDFIEEINTLNFIAFVEKCCENINVGSYLIIIEKPTIEQKQFIIDIYNKKNVTKKIKIDFNVYIYGNTNADHVSEICEIDKSKFTNLYKEKYYLDQYKFSTRKSLIKLLNNGINIVFFGSREVKDFVLPEISNEYNKHVNFNKRIFFSDLDIQAENKHVPFDVLDYVCFLKENEDHTDGFFFVNINKNSDDYLHVILEYDDSVTGFYDIGEFNVFLKYYNELLSMYENQEKFIETKDLDDDLFEGKFISLICKHFE